MKRLLEDSEPSLSALTELLAASKPHEPNPFAKRLVQSRLNRELAGRPRRFPLRSVWVGLSALLLAASAAAAAGYSFLASPSEQPFVPPPGPIEPRVPTGTAPRVATPAIDPPVVLAPPPNDAKPLARPAEKPRAGEDPSQVAEAVRALRKQGDPVRAQALLDQYLRQNPRGALSEDALALSIEAAAARKDPRAADHARRYLARYPNGRFRGLAERVLAGR
jgi:hypothetical protein